MNLEQSPHPNKLFWQMGKLRPKDLLELGYGPEGNELLGLLPSTCRSTWCCALRETSKEHSPR